MALPVESACFREWVRVPLGFLVPTMRERRRLLIRERLFAMPPLVIRIMQPDLLLIPTHGVRRPMLVRCMRTLAMPRPLRCLDSPRSRMHTTTDQM